MTLSFIEEGDPRYTLTPEEKIEVQALKNKCDEENIEYVSIFELAKYCMVSSSIKNVNKRREDSFNRIKKKRQFEKKHALTQLDLFKCIDELEENLPQWAISCGKINGKWCVGYTSEASNPDYMMKSLNTIFKVEMARFDLAASDLEEARNGLYIIGTGKDLKASPLRCMRAAVKMKALFDKMHSNRIKGIFYEAPRPIVLISNLFLSVVPKTVRERIKLTGSLQSLRFWDEHKAEMEAALPEKLGGTHKQQLREWFDERMDARRVTDSRVRLD